MFPGVGLSIGVTRLVMRMLSQQMAVASRSVPTAVYVALTADEDWSEAQDVAALLRQRGIPAEVAVSAEKFGKQIKYADRRGIPFVWFMGRDDAGARVRGRVPGAAARERELRKHKRYPGPGLCAAAVESGGRMGAEFLAFLRAHAPSECGRVRAEALADVKQRLVVAVARGHAAMLLRSAGARARPWPSPCQSAGPSRARR